LGASATGGVAVTVGVCGWCSAGIGATVGGSGADGGENIGGAALGAANRGGEACGIAGGAPNFGCACGGGKLGCGAGVGCGARAGAAAAATAAEPHDEPGIGACAAEDCTGVTGWGLAPTLLNETGSDEIARGFANGMTFAGAGAGPDRTDGSFCGEREPVGDGAADAFGARDGGGSFLTSTVVTSPISCCRGTLGMTRNSVTGSCATFGRGGLRWFIAGADASAKQSPA
jgi:hypothetical protein